MVKTSKPNAYGQKNLTAKTMTQDQILLQTHYKAFARRAKDNAVSAIEDALKQHKAYMDTLRLSEVPLNMLDKEYQRESALIKAIELIKQ